MIDESNDIGVGGAATSSHAADVDTITVALVGIGDFVKNLPDEAVTGHMEYVLGDLEEHAQDALVALARLTERVSSHARETAEVEFVQALRALELELPEAVYRDFAEKTRAYMAALAAAAAREQALREALTYYAAHHYDSGQRARAAIAVGGEQQQQQQLGTRENPIKVSDFPLTLAPGLYWFEVKL